MAANDSQCQCRMTESPAARLRPQSCSRRSCRSTWPAACCGPSCGCKTQRWAAPSCGAGSLHGVGGTRPSCVAKSLFWMTFVFTAVIHNCDPKQRFKTASGIRQQWTTRVAKLREITNHDHINCNHSNHAKFVISRDQTNSRSQCVIHRLSP